jgi:hypothetical protein
MHMRFLTAALAALSLTVPATAQKLGGMAATSMRAETRIMAATEDFSVFTMASLTYGQPEWQAQYDAMIDKLKGKVNRLGKDWFTTLISLSDLEIGGAKIPAGSYIVGLHCDQDGKFALALMDSTKAMKDKVYPGMDFKPEIVCPLTLNKDAAKEVVAKLTMTFDAKQADGGKGTFTLAWGKHTLTAPVQIHAPK